MISAEAQSIEGSGHLEFQSTLCLGITCQQH